MIEMIALAVGASLAFMFFFPSLFTTFVENSLLFLVLAALLILVLVFLFNRLELLIIGHNVIEAILLIDRRLFHYHRR